MFGLMVFDDLQADSLLGRGGGRLFTGRALIDERQFHFFIDRCLRRLGQLPDLRSVLLIRWRHTQRQQVPQRIHRQMHLGALSFFVSIEPGARATFRR